MSVQVSSAGVPARNLISAATFLIALMAGFAAAAPARATTATGRTVGTFAVSPTGAATYTIPIWAPPGPNAMQPRIALTYNSQLGNGYVGVGWSVSGLSSIYRCNLTYAQDAAPAPVALVTGDGYCMDGQRLRLTSTNNYGMDGSTYQTEIANFFNVTAHGSAGNGPAYWTAQDRNGRTYTYGAGGTSTNAQVLATGTSTAIAWELNEVSDTSSNTMTVAYSTATGTTVPVTIAWTPSSHGSSTYNYTMTFAYGANVVPPYGYVGGTSFTNPNLLSSIAVAYSGTAVKTYYLTYTASSTTGRDTLTQVQECAGTGTSNCLSPTTVTYQPGAAGVGSGTAVGGGMEFVVSTAFDFNGDGTNDLVGYGSTGALQVAFGSATGYGTPVSAPSGAIKAFGDVDGSGVAGILANVSGTWYYYKWNGSAFAGTSTGISVATAASPILADVDGDGRADFVYTDSSGIVHVRLSTSTAGTVSFSSTDINTGVGIAGFIVSAQIAGSNRALHFWGAAQADLLGTEKTCAQYNAKHICIAWQYIYYALHFTGSTFSIAGLFPAPLSSPNPAVDFADYNNDGCTDILTATALLLSACNGTAPVSVALPSGVTAVGGMDWNGDGRRDVLVKQANGNLGVVLSTGSGLSSTVIGTSYSAASTSYAAAPNLTGDGQDGLIGWNGTSATYYLHASPGAPPDLLTSVTDGYGNSASPTYVSLAQNNYSDSGFGPATYPDQLWIGPMYVVSQVTLSDPSSSSGGTYTQSFWYYTAWSNLQGRGWEAFAATRTYDSRNALYDYQYFERSFPYTGMQYQDIVSNGSFYPSEWTSSPTYRTLSSTQYQQRYFPYGAGVTAYRWEVGGSENSDLITTTSTSYTYDNYGNATSITKTVTDNDPNSPYVGAANAFTTTTTVTPYVDDPTYQTVALGAWCLGLIETVEVQYTGGPSGSAAVTRTKTSTANTTTDLPACRHTSLITEPSSGSYKVTEAFVYDAFGNISTDTVTGVGMTARQTTLNWGTTGQFVNTLTDPSGALTTWTYTSAQSLAFGVPDSVKDANNLITQWSYDGFGRKIQEIRPDSTSTTWSWTTCTSHCGWGNSEYQVAQTTYQTNGSTVIRTDTTLYDPIDRVTQTSGPAVTGGNVVVQNTYNSIYSQGALTFQQSLPFFSGGTVNQQSYSFDVLGRLTAVQRGAIPPTSYAYAGRTTTITDANQNAKTLITDVNGWLRVTKDAKGYAITLAYDAAGGKTSVTDNQSNTLWSTTAPAYAYGIKPMLLNFTDADLGNWTATSYDALGELTGWKDAKGQQFTTGPYDALGRVTDRYEPDLYTHWTWGSSPSAHEMGQLHSVCTGTGTNPTSCTSATGYAESETYDSVGRPYQRAIQIPSDMTYTYTRTYNSATGLSDTLAYPATPSGYQLKLQFAYSNGLLQTITDANTNLALWTGTTVDAQGHFSAETLGNGVVVNSTFDAVTGWLSKRTAGVGSGSSALQNNSYLFDNVGNLTQRQDNNVGVTENVYPDVLNRLDHTVGDTSTNLTYDSMGRLATWEALGATANVVDYTTQQAGCTYYANAQPHAARKSTQGQWVSSLCYDANGNMTSFIAQPSQSVLTSATWTSYNQPLLISAPQFNNSSSQFSYDHNHQRWLQVASYSGSNETTEYIGGLLEKMTNSSGTAYRYYVPAGNNFIVYNDWNTSAGLVVSYVTKDHLGSSYNISDKNGNSVLMNGTSVVNEKYSAMGWEEVGGQEGTIATVSRHQFTGQEDLYNVGLVNMNGRVYNPSGLYMLSPDPYIPDPTDTRSYNRYAYANYNPLTLVDPTGFDADCADPPCGGGGGGGDGNDGNGGNGDNPPPPPPMPPAPPPPPGYKNWTCIQMTDGTWSCGGVPSDPSDPSYYLGVTGSRGGFAQPPGSPGGSPGKPPAKPPAKPKGNQNAFQKNAAFNQCMADRVGALGFGLDQIASLFGVNSNMQQAFSQSVFDIEAGGAVNMLVGTLLAGGRTGLGGSVVPRGMLWGSQAGETLFGATGGEIGAFLGQATSAGVAISGSFAGSYLATSAIICFIQTQ